tara:strand:- start:272 stop:415 length:144 start_codon:yes stop_codon:yes gene_type:complete
LYLQKKEGTRKQKFSGPSKKKKVIRNFLQISEPSMKGQSPFGMPKNL